MAYAAHVLIGYYAVGWSGWRSGQCSLLWRYEPPKRADIGIGLRSAAISTQSLWNEFLLTSAIRCVGVGLYLASLQSAGATLLL